MKKLFALWLLISCIYIISSCEEDNSCCNPEIESTLSGSWLLFERGYSPGSGYIVEPVNETPPQTVEIQPDGRFSSNIQELEKYRYYLILQDRDWDVLALFERKPTLDDQKIDSLEHSYNIEFQEDHTVKLYFRFCIEGCHLGLRKQ